MIRLTKGEEPAVLVEKGADWTRVLRDHELAGTTPSDYQKSRYRHPQIKDALLRETHGKCAYCESKLLHIAFGDVEHITPKSTDVALIFRWENLTIACDVCNTKKAAHFGNHDELVDPYCCEPADHLAFIGSLVMPRPGSDSGLLTEEILGLNRDELVTRRVERIKYMCRILHQYATAKSETVKKIVRAQIEKELDDEREYAACVRAYVSQELNRLGG